MTPPTFSAEQIQEFYTQRILSAALERAASNDDERPLAPGTEASLVRHARSVAAEMPAALDEAYVLQLQGQLALALNTIESMADEGDDNYVSNPAASSSARQLADAAARRGRRRRHHNRNAEEDDEASMSLGLVASLQVDLSRTRERMSDALSVARSHSHRSINFDAMDSDAISLDAADLNGLIVGPLEQDLNDVEQPPMQLHRWQDNADDDDKDDNDQEAEMLACIATLQFDLLQTREKLMDERSFSRSGHVSTDGTTLDTTPAEERASTIESTTTPATSTTTPAVPTAAAIATAVAAAPQVNTVDGATARLASLAATTKNPDATTSSAQGTRMRSPNLTFRPFSNQQA